MRFALPKNRTAPLIIFAIFGIILSLTLGLYHIYRMVQYCYDKQSVTYNSISDNTATLLQQELNDVKNSLQVSADFAAKEDIIDKENTLALLNLINADHPYVDLILTNQEGKGYNIAGLEQNVSDQKYFDTIQNGRTYISEKISYVGEVPVITFALPIIEKGAIKGAIIAKLNAQIGNISILNEEVSAGGLIYLVNNKDELVAYVKGMKVSIYDFSTVLSQGVFYNNTNIEEEIVPLSLLLEEDLKQDSYIWYKKQLGWNGWSILYGHKYTIDALTLDIFKLTNIMWLIVILSTLFLFILMIITQIRSNRKVIKTLYLDPVTGGNNWYKFRMNVNKILNSKQFAKKKYAIINFDINRFKIINDAYGYHKGDEVLKDIFNIIKKWSRHGEPYTRYAADQFYILMSFSQEEELTERINYLNDCLHELRYTKTARIFYGVYYITERKDSIDRMGEFAQTAKNNIKGLSDGFIAFFDDAARVRLLEEEEIEKSMNEALRNNEFQVYLQPKYTTKEEVITGAEALVRWRNSSGKPVSPGYFIPVFEKNGFITELDYYMLRKVCELLRNWLDLGYHALPISVNISRLHFANAHLAEIITEIVDSYEVPHHLIEIELTESAFLQDKTALIDTVRRLREYGFLVSMDDFGAGYSSLNSLKDLPLDVVKLDGELFKMTNEVERGLTVIRNTINMAKDLHIKVVAECIETREQVEFLCNVGCDIIQGYYFAKPMPVDQFEQRYLAS